MSKQYFEWSHQLRHVNDGSTIGTSQKKRIVIVLSWVCRKSVVWHSCDSRAIIVRQSWVVWSYFSGFHVMGWAFYCRVTVVSLSYDCCATVMRFSEKALETCQAPYVWIQRNHRQIPATTLVSVYFTAQTSGAVRSMAYQTNFGRLTGSFTVHGLESTLTEPYFDLVGVREGGYSAVPSIIVLME